MSLCKIVFQKTMSTAATSVLSQTCIMSVSSSNSHSATPPASSKPPTTDQTAGPAYKCHTFRSLGPRQTDPPEGAQRKDQSLSRAKRSKSVAQNLLQGIVVEELGRHRKGTGSEGPSVWISLPPPPETSPGTQRNQRPQNTTNKANQNNGPGEVSGGRGKHKDTRSKTRRRTRSEPKTGFKEKKS